MVVVCAQMFVDNALLKANKNKPFPIRSEKRSFRLDRCSSVCFLVINVFMPFSVFLKLTKFGLPCLCLGFLKDFANLCKVFQKKKQNVIIIFIVGRKNNNVI